MICPKCGMFNPDGTPVCESCGQQLISQEEQLKSRPQYNRPTKYCTHCGAQIDAVASICIKCGYSQKRSANPAQTQEVGDGSGFGVLGFFFPMLGLILYLIWNDTKPRHAKKAGKGALIGAIVSVACSALYYIIYFVFIFAKVSQGF